jgi:hypothetical protein
MTFDQQEPSANSPWTKTTFFVFRDVCALATWLSRGAAAAAATAPINVRRFIHGLPVERMVCGPVPTTRWDQCDQSATIFLGNDARKKDGIQSDLNYPTIPDRCLA